MLPPFYQTLLRKHLSESQDLTLELLLLLIHTHRCVTLSTLASVFPQPIQESSRLRNLQRFRLLPQLSVKLLWFPLLKYLDSSSRTRYSLKSPTATASQSA